MLINGIDVNDINTASLRAAVGFVQQEPVLLPGTIGSAIGYGLPVEARNQAIAARAGGRWSGRGEGDEVTISDIEWRSDK